jgi:membrane associated rhomboid family serine protease
VITLALFLTGVLSLIFFDPSVTAFYYKKPDGIMWFIRIFTHMVSHGNLRHLLGNFLFGLPFMLYAEYRLQDHKKFLKLFFYCGLAAVLGQGIIDRFSVLPAMGVIGSSGAVFGIVAFALAIANENKWVRIMSLSTLAFHIYNQGMLTWYSLQGLTWGVAFGAHLCGILTGIFCAFILRHHLRRHRKTHRSRRNRSRK